MEFTANQIAIFLNGEVVGNENIRVSNVSKIEEGKPGTLAFLGNAKYESYLYSTEASVVLINRDFSLREKTNATLIKVDNAYEAFASLLDLVSQASQTKRSGTESPVFIDKTAVIGEGTFIGAFSYLSKNSVINNKSQIYAQVFVGENVTIGEGTILYSGVKIYDGCIIGANCIIHSGAVIGSDGFGFAPQNDGTYKKIPQIGNVIIEDNVEIGANTTIDCGTMGSTIIRNGAKIDNLIQIGHNCEIGENTVIAAQTGLAGSTKLGRNCRIGGQVGFAGHLSVGNNVQIGAQAGVSKSVNSDETLWGTPAFNHMDVLKSSVIFRNLPKLRDEVFKLQKELNHLKQSIKDITKR